MKTKEQHEALVEKVSVILERLVLAGVANARGMKEAEAEEFIWAAQTVNPTGWKRYELAGGVVISIIEND